MTMRELAVQVLGWPRPWLRKPAPTAFTEAWPQLGRIGCMVFGLPVIAVMASYAAFALLLPPITAAVALCGLVPVELLFRLARGPVARFPGLLLAVMRRPGRLLGDARRDDREAPPCPRCHARHA